MTPKEGDWMFNNPWQKRRAATEVFVDSLLDFFYSVNTHNSGSLEDCGDTLNSIEGSRVEGLSG